MHYHLRILSFASFTVLFWVTSPVLFLGYCQSLFAKAQTTQNQAIAADKTKNFRSFFDWCSHKDNLSQAQRYTVEVLLQKVGTSDCSQANEILSNITDISLDDQRIADIQPLSNLTNLTWLFLNNNQIRDITSLSELAHLTNLSLDNNQIRDISPLSQLTSLTYLSIENNQIRELNALLSIKNLTEVDFTGNSINPEEAKNITLFANTNRVRQSVSCYSPWWGFSIYEEWCELENADLRDADLIGADLSQANLRGADLSNADLVAADLSQASLQGANLAGADLEAADLSEANLSGANLIGANFRDANLCGAVMPDGIVSQEGCK